MRTYENFVIRNSKSLKEPTVYFFLKSNNFSEHQIKALRKNENSFMLNGQICSIREKLTDGDTLEVLINPQISGSQIAPCEGPLNILFEDDDYIIVNKPHNLSCIPTRSHYNDNLGGRVLSFMNKKSSNFVLRIVNRLDKDTAGIVIIAKSAAAYNNIGKIDKTYYALCNGALDFKQLTINKPILTISKNGINQMKRVVSPEGKPSITHVFVEKGLKESSLIRLKLETGRTHQIRVHLSHIGHSLVGDRIYSPVSELEGHTFLILKEISFLHPKTKQQISLSIPFPDEWNKYLNGSPK